MSETRWTLFAGSAHPQLAAAVARELKVRLGACAVARFPDGEVSIRLDESVRAHAVVLLQPTGPPVNDNLVELLAFVDACRRAAARHIIAIIPYFGYARSDRRRARREPIGASMVAAALEAAGVQQVVALDIHSPAIEGFFRVPFDNLTALPLLASALAPHTSAETVVVAPDLGRARAAAELATLLKCSVAVVHKRRLTGATVEALQLVGEVRDRACVILDDMISTGATVLASVDALERAGARSGIVVAATHGVFSERALQRLAEAGIACAYVTDSLPPPVAPPLRVEVLSTAALLATSIGRILNGESLADLT
jgi:ribose-phosphate pyrophosphokinase